jgi:hypothetical protein
MLGEEEPEMEASSELEPEMEMPETAEECDKMIMMLEAKKAELLKK